MVVFKTIDRLPGYKFGDDGSVWSMRFKKREWRQLKPLLDRNGYGMVCVRPTNNQRKKEFIHRLIAEAFHGPCPPGLVCCHNDGVPSNCRPENLRWDTMKSNAADAIRHGSVPTGGRARNSVLGVSERSWIRAVYNARIVDQPTIAAAFRVSQATVSHIVHERYGESRSQARERRSADGTNGKLIRGVK